MVSVSFQHANHRDGNESFLLRFEEEMHNPSPCLLVDAGDGVDLDKLLDDDEYLCGILLTHGHYDHIIGLSDVHRDRAPIFAPPDTIEVLEQTFSDPEILNKLCSKQDSHALASSEEISDYFTPVPTDEWTTILGDSVQVRPVSVGHTPGATGYLIQVRGEDSFTALITGDFTVRDAAGYRGFSPEDYFGVDALFLCGATSEGATEVLQQAVTNPLKRAQQGSTVLCTCSGLTGVHLATVMVEAIDILDHPPKIQLVGHVAKLYEGLNYSHPLIETTEVFSDPTEVLNPGDITISGPEVPVAGSSKVLFGQLEDDPNASVFEVRSGGHDGETRSISGSHQQLQFSNHPPESVLDEVVATIEPTHTVIVHQRGRAQTRFKDKWTTFTWAINSDQRECLFENGQQQPPEWVGQRLRETVLESPEKNTGFESRDLLLNRDLPEVAQNGVRLEREGIEKEELRDALQTYPSRSALDTEDLSTDTRSSEVSTVSPSWVSSDSSALGSLPVPRKSGDSDSSLQTGVVEADLGPVTLYLLQELVDQEETTLKRFSQQAMSEYIQMLLREQGSRPADSFPEPDPLSVISVGAVQETLYQVVSSDRDRSLESLLIEDLKQSFDLGGTGRTVSVNCKPLTPFLTAVVENESLPYDSKSDILIAALRHQIKSRYD